MTATLMQYSYWLDYGFSALYYIALIGKYLIEKRRNKNPVVTDIREWELVDLETPKSCNHVNDNVDNANDIDYTNDNVANIDYANDIFRVDEPVEPIDHYKDEKTALEQLLIEMEYSKYEQSMYSIV